MADLCRVDKISVVRQRECSLDIIQNERLRVLTVRRSGRRIAAVTDPDIAMKAVQILLFKHLADETEIFMIQIIVRRLIRIGYCDAARFLSSVLKRAEAIINKRCDISAVSVISTENTALFSHTMLFILELLHIFSRSIDRASVNL